MTKTETTLFHGAEYRWPGSGKPLVVIYQCVKASGRGAGIGAAMTINIGLTEARARSEMMKLLRTQVEKAAATRSGPKRDRYLAALEALAALEKL